MEHRAKTTIRKEQPAEPFQSQNIHIKRVVVPSAGKTKTWWFTVLHEKKNRKKRKERILNNIISGLLNSMVWKENEESGWCTNLCTLVKLKATSTEIRTLIGSNSMHRFARQLCDSQRLPETRHSGFPAKQTKFNRIFSLFYYVGQSPSHHLTQK